MKILINECPKISIFKEYITKIPPKKNKDIKEEEERPNIQKKT